jgi:hypothetical protein
LKPNAESYVHDTSGDEELARQHQEQLELEDTPSARNEQREILASDTVVGLYVSCVFSVVPWM